MSSLGKRIVFCLFEFFKRHQSLLLYQYVVMPDHVHLLIRVCNPLPKHLGFYIGNLTGAIGRDWAARNGLEVTPIFEEGYNDKIIGQKRSLDTIFQYIRDNPRRLAVRMAYPDFFRRLNELVIGGIRCKAYGNIQLLDNPFKEQVVVHRSDSQETRRHNREFWGYTAANGGVLVSPFISKDEKAIRVEAEALGGRLILITTTPMGERYKPASHDFSLCEQGRLLIISMNQPGEINRSRCVAMNSLAKVIAEMEK